MFTVAADITLERRVVDVDVNGATAGGELDNAILLSFSLSNFSASTAAFGLSLTSGSLTIARLAPSAVDAAAGDTRAWLGVYGTGLGASFEVSELLSASVSDLTLKINRAAGTTGAESAERLDWTAVFAPDVIDLDAATTFEVVGHAEVSIAEDLIAGSADFETPHQVLDVNIGTDYTNAELERAVLLTVGLTNFAAGVGEDEFGVRSAAGSSRSRCWRPVNPRTPGTPPLG